MRTPLLTLAPLLLFAPLARQCDPPPPPPPEVWIFCGADAEAADAEQVAASLRASGATATMGRCALPTGPYSPADTADRYTSRHGYGLLIGLNARHGMRTVVYDPGLWSDDPTERQAALDYYLPVIGNVAAWDMGDEFDPAGPEWATLVHRWNIVLTHITPVTGVRPFTSHLPERYGSLDAAARDLPGAAFVGVNEYDMPAAIDTVRRWAPHARIMAAVNAYALPYLPTHATKISADTRAVLAAGAAGVLVFGGAPVAGAAEFAPAPEWGAAIAAGIR